MHPEEVLIPIFLFGGGSLVLWKFFETRNRERMAMIEKGVNPAEFKGAGLAHWLKTNPLSSLKWGMLALFVGIGLMFATIFERKMEFPDSIYPASMLISGGVGLVLYYFIAAKKSDNS